MKMRRTKTLGQLIKSQTAEGEGRYYNSIGTLIWDTKNVAVADVKAALFLYGIDKKKLEK